MEISIRTATQSRVSGLESVVACVARGFPGEPMAIH